MKNSWILVAVVLCACRPSAPPAAESSPPASEPPKSVEINHAEMALVSLAHRRIGPGNNYSGETISDAGGATKVCGEFTTPANPNNVVRYSYSLEGTHAYGPTEDAAWDAACANGWEPGTGRRKAP